MKDQDHKRKMVAPITVTVLLVLYYVLYFGLIFYLVDLFWFRVIFGIVPLFIGGMTIYVCVQRIKEIQRGEEDDLSKY